ncbi:MAG: PHP domain-containing protein, partial [Cyanobacteria bacterium J06639_1]
MVAQLKWSHHESARHERITPSASLAELQLVWSQLDRDSCPQSYNFHMHTVHSDGRLTPDALVWQVCDIGLKGFAITDHHSVNGYLQARHLIPANGPQIWSGVEITAALLGDEVHILGYGFDPHHAALAPYLSGDRAPESDFPAEKTIAALHAAGGLAVLAHPFRYRLSAEALVAAAASA